MKSAVLAACVASFLTLGLAAEAPAQSPASPLAFTPEGMVTGWYQTYLRRNPGPRAMIWVDALRSGQAPDVVLANILSGREYYRKSGNTTTGFINMLYMDLVGRTPTAQEIRYWTARLTGGSTRAEMAYELMPH